MRKSLLFGLLLATVCTASAQSWLDAVQSPYPNLDSASRILSEYWRDKTEEKGRGIKVFRRWEWFWQSRLQPGESLPKRSIAFEEWQRYQSNAALRTQQTANANWTSVGPSTASGGYWGVGRLNAIAFHPTNANIFYVGAPAGGLWRTTNNGITWTPLTDNLPVIGISDIAIDPSNPNTIYIATGDGNGVDTYSIGVLKSTDAGATWNTTGMSFTVTSARLIRRMVINPQNPQMLWVATSDGVWRTTDGAVSWTRTLTGSYFDLELSPINPSIVHAVSYSTSANSGIFRSTDAGATFNLIQTVTGGVRMNLAVAPSNANLIHVVACNSSGGLHSLWKSSDGGLTYTQYVTGTSSNNMLHSSATGNGSGGQGTYDLALAINPADSNNIWLGGVNTWSSDDGGTTWNIRTVWSGGLSGGAGVPVVHADKHFIAYHPLTGVMYECNDGGLYRTADRGFNWTDLSNGLGIGQIYRIGVSASTLNQVLAGFQDNSTKELSNNTWFERMGTGDGFENIYEPGNPSVMYISSYYGNIRRSLNGGTSWSTVVQSSGTGVNSQGPWLTPYIMNPSSSNTLLVAKREVFRSYDRGTSWTQLSSFGTTTNATAIAYAPSDTNTIYAAFGTRLSKSIDGGATWSTAFTATSSISYIAVHPTNPQRLWVTHGTYTGIKVQTSADGGSTWANLSGTLPNLPVNCIVYQVGSNDQLYIGTDVGVYQRNATMADWAPYQTGLPNVIVNELEISYNNSRIWAATYGRGLWASPIIGSVPCTRPAAPTAGSNQSVCPGASTSVTISATPPANAVVDWYTTSTGGTPVATNSNTYTTSTPGIYYAESKSTIDGCTSVSRTPVTISAGVIPATPTITPSGSTTFCNGNSVTLTSSAASGNQWLNNSSPIAGATGSTLAISQSGSYTVRVTSAGCTSAQSAPMVVTVNPVPAQPTITVVGAQLTSSAGSGNQWFLNGTAIAGATASTHTATASGTYTVIVTVNGCASQASLPHNHSTTSTPVVALDQQLQIAPNPVRHNLEIVYNGPAASFELELLDMKGRTLRRSGRFTLRYSLSMQPFASGSYIVRITNMRTGERTQQIIVKQ